MSWIGSGVLVGPSASFKIFALRMLIWLDAVREVLPLIFSRGGGYNRGECLQGGYLVEL